MNLKEGKIMVCEECGLIWKLTKEDIKKKIIICPKCNSRYKPE